MNPSFFRQVIMVTYTQETRLLTLTTPLGADVLLLTAFAGREELSRLFHYELDMLSEEATIAPRDILGQHVTWNVEHFDKQPRHFNGVVSRFVPLDRQIHGLRVYRAEVVPWTWFLTRTADCRIFQNKSVPDIIKAVFDGFGLTDYEFALSGSYAPREYCVQYRETAFDFISRLMEQEGIFYRFRHEDGKHTMVLGDSNRVFEDCRENRVKYSPGSLTENHIFSWQHRYEFLSGKWSQTDYNFKTPTANLLTNTVALLDTPGIAEYELFDYPGLYTQSGEGRSLAKVRMEEVETPYDVAAGSSWCCTFTPGGKFTLSGHDCNEENKGYVVTSIEHSAVDHSYTNEGTGSEYSNTFTCIPDAVSFRPARRTPKAVVRGPQTAVVVGPAGEEIYTDQYGRVKVQFFWDRQGKFDENSSCWVRVSENWAGKNFGVVFHPRIGQEVIVEHLEGDPDRPIITGRVYNAVQMPPYPLPGQQTRSGIKTRSSKGGSASQSNELYFEDQSGSEDIYFHAQKDFHRVVENHDDLQVHNDQTIHVATTSTFTAGESITLKVGENSITIDQQGVSISAMSITLRAMSVQIGNGEVAIKAANFNVMALTTIDGVPGPYIPAVP
jgi:type VI secretion system secreted protein VgrG